MYVFEQDDCVAPLENEVNNNIDGSDKDTNSEIENNSDIEDEILKEIEEEDNLKLQIEAEESTRRKSNRNKRIKIIFSKNDNDSYSDEYVDDENTNNQSTKIIKESNKKRKKGKKSITPKKKKPIKKIEEPPILQYKIQYILGRKTLIPAEWR